MTQTPDSRYSLRHNPSGTAVELLDDDQVIGEVNYLEVELPDGSSAWDLVHTGVRQQYQNQGLASDLVRFTLETAQAGGHKIIPTCPYVALWLRRHPEFASSAVQGEGR
ncbi:GNAT family N-acetyltransferase [Kocuria soli]|nr:GNAT family N-acetyltransferase [Kocuria soli]